MAYSRFDDTILLLLDLCQHLDDDEIMCLMDVKLLMVKNKNFADDYAAAARSIYMKNFYAIQNQTYEPQHFADVHAQIVRYMESSSTESVRLLNSIKNSHNAQTISDLRAKIAKLKGK